MGFVFSPAIENFNRTFRAAGEYNTLSVWLERMKACGAFGDASETGNSVLIAHHSYDYNVNMYRFECLIGKTTNNEREECFLGYLYFEGIEPGVPVDTPDRLFYLVNARILRDYLIEKLGVSESKVENIGDYCRIGC